METKIVPQPGSTRSCSLTPGRIVRRVERQIDAHRRSLFLHAFPALKFNPSTMSLNELLRNEKTDAGPNRVAGGEESVENLRDVHGRNAHARVLNFHDDALFCRVSVFD